MIENIFTVATYVIILFVLIATGFACNKTKLISEQGIKGMTDFALYIVTPCVLINSYQREFDADMLHGLVITAVASVASFALSILFAHIIIHDSDKRREKILRFGTVFSNCGYMALPLQSAMLGADGVFYGATYIAVFQVVLWTYGITLMSGDAGNISLKKIFINPGIIGTALGLAVFVFSIKLPFVISEPISYFAALNTPIPMVIVGYHLAGANIKIKGANAYIAIAMRLILSPLLMLAGLKLCGVSGTVTIACVIATSASVAASSTMFAEKFSGDTGLASAMVSVTTLLSIITMPIIVGIATLV